MFQAMKCAKIALLCLTFGVWDPAAASTQDLPGPPAEGVLAEALQLSGDNRAQIERAIESVAEDMLAGMHFLVANMPEQDLRSLDATFLLDHVRGAYRAWREAPWAEQIPEEVFLDAILPYANVSERRDAWREELAEKFSPLVEEAKTPSEAAVLLNQRAFPLAGVKYSTDRPKADQSPSESMEAGTASCTGLSILLIDACRAVGVPARFVGTPRWSDNSGNHSWVEIWDGDWHFTGACEPTGDHLDQAWFTARAATADRDDPRHAIYAVTWRRTPLTFPLVWSRRGPRVHAVNVTDRYTDLDEPLADGYRHLRLRVIGPDRERVTAKLTVADAEGKVLFEGESKDERFDANDHVTLGLAEGSTVQVRAEGEDGTAESEVTMGSADQLVTMLLAARSPGIHSKERVGVLEELGRYLEVSPETRPKITTEDLASVPLTRGQAEEAARLLWEDHSRRIREERREEMDARVLRQGERSMPFEYRIFGEATEGGRSLYISLHGGGGTAPQVNDRQWKNQQGLYEPEEGVYLAPRAPTDAWNLWHQSHIDSLFDRLIENLIVFERVNPDRVYLMGYSAGGDGVYQVAPRMADRFAAAAMMAGHPNEARPLGLRNLPFTLHMGADDGAYNRNKVAAQWKQLLADLQATDPEGYEHWVEIHEGKGHWMDRQDAAAVPWMAKFTRDPFPEKVVWFQDDVTEPRFYWLAVDEDSRRGGTQVVAKREAQQIEIEASGVARLTLLWNDTMADLDRPVLVRCGDRVLFEGKLERTIETLARTLSERGDPRSIYSAEVTVDLPTTER